ncbi:MAG: aminotransferase class V-fold PLP-dependent enzyme [Eubacteriales bacterium]
MTINNKTPKNEVYFDNAASAIPFPSALEEASYAALNFANPSSTHHAGLTSRKIIETARERVASSLGADSKEIFFTPSGTVSNNLAIFSLAAKNRVSGNAIITTRAEHVSVLLPLKQLEDKGFKIVYIPVDGGEVNYSALESALLGEKACLVTLMQANNQNGALTDLKLVRELITKTGSSAYFHSDLVQSYTKVGGSPSVAAENCDTFSISSHKIGGIKGVGGLFVKKGLSVSPLIYGGGQENGLWSGTENLPAIAAFGRAAEEWSLRGKEHLAKVSEFRDYFLLKAKISLGGNIDFKIPVYHITSLVSLSLKGVKSEVAQNSLSQSGIYVSSSSACSSRAKENTQLAAFGYGKDYTSFALRIAFSPLNTKQEIDLLVEGLAAARLFKSKGEAEK